MTVVLDNDRLDYPTRVRVRELSHPCTGQGIIPPVYGSGNQPAIYACLRLTYDCGYKGQCSYTEVYTSFLSYGKHG